MYLSLLTTNPVILRSPIPLGATQATSGGAGAQLRCRKPAPIDALPVATDTLGTRPLVE